jgi:hypothetical protein
VSNEVHCVDQLRQIQINTEKQIGSNFRILGSWYTDKNKMKWFASSRGTLQLHAGLNVSVLVLVVFVFFFMF